MDPKELATESIRSANGDLRLAISLLKGIHSGGEDDDVDHRNCSFHLQQAAEKYFKALLYSHGKTIPKIHDSQKLLSEVSSIEQVPRDIVVNELALLGVGVRYADYLDDIPEVSELKMAVQECEQIRDWVVSVIQP